MTAPRIAVAAPAPAWDSSGPASPGPRPGLAFPLLDRLVGLGVVEAEERDAFLEERADRLRELSSDDRLGRALVQAGLLTSYQFGRVQAEQTHGLVLGCYRILDELGRGGMGTVYRAEHRTLKRKVASKVVPLGDDCSPIIRKRFQTEMRLLAELYHPHIVLALDAGELAGVPGQVPLVYLVMELIEGGDLEQLVARQGVCTVPQACRFIHQAAGGLQAAHDRHLIHRDVKPSNLLLSAQGQVKLVDFGLARRFVSRLTDPRALLGSVDFMAPEQSYDPSTVGKEADVYDTLRRMRLYKPALSHQAAIRIMLDRSEGQFDPALVRALARCHQEFERIFRDIEE
jgi:serine/threonine-protein kinase